MIPFNPNLSDNITTVDDVVFILVYALLFVGVFGLCECIREVIYYAKAHHYRRKMRKEWLRMREERRLVGEKKHDIV